MAAIMKTFSRNISISVIIQAGSIGNNKIQIYFKKNQSRRKVSIILFISIRCISRRVNYDIFNNETTYSPWLNALKP